MKPIINEIQFFGTPQRDIMVSMCNSIIANYNQISGAESLQQAKEIIDGDLYEFANDLREITGN